MLATAVERNFCGVDLQLRLTRKIDKARENFLKLKLI